MNTAFSEKHIIKQVELESWIAWARDIPTYHDPRFSLYECLRHEVEVAERKKWARQREHIKLPPYKKVIKEKISLTAAYSMGVSIFLQKLRLALP